MKHWALLLAVAAVVGGLAGWLGSRAGRTESPPPIPAAPQQEEPVSARPTPAVQPAVSRQLGLPPPIALPPRETPRPKAGGPAPLPAVLPSVTSQIADSTADQRLATAESLLARGTPADKWDAVNVLAGTKDPRAYDLARRLVRDKDLDVATGAAHVLAMGPGLAGEDVQALKDMMGDASIIGGERAGYNAAIMSAMRMGKAPGDLIAHAMKALESDASEVRGSVVANVVTLPSDAAVPVLVKALSDANGDVANGAWLALVHGHGGDPELGKDPAAWAAWWEKNKDKPTADTSGAAPPPPEDFARPEAPPPVHVPADPSPDED
ncbi:MAG: hypothetical protein AMXMBFR23_28600 [Chloroflexota bacterium]